MSKTTKIPTTKTRTKKAEWAHIQQIIAKAAADTGGGAGGGLVGNQLNQVTQGGGALNSLAKSVGGGVKAPTTPAVAPQKPAVEPPPANVPPPPPQVPPASGLPTPPTMAQAQQQQAQSPVPTTTPALVSPEQVNPASGQISGQVAGSPNAEPQPGQPVTSPAEPVKQPVTPPVESSVQTTELPAADAPGSEIFDDPPPVDIKTVETQVASAKTPEEATAAVKPLITDDKKKLADAVQQGDEKAKAQVQETGVNALLAEEQKNNPNPDPQTYGQMASNAWTKYQNLDPASQLLIGIGLPVGIIGILSSLFGEGGATGGILGALGLGAAGLAATNAGMFGNDARAGLGGVVADVGNFFGAVPDASAFTPEGMQAGQDKAQADIRAAMDKAKAEGGDAWAAGQQTFQKATQPLDRLHSIGPEAGTTMLMGILKTNDPAVARAKYDELMSQRAQFQAPDYLKNQVGAAAADAMYLPSWMPGRQWVGDTAANWAY